jgi:hypothetical protein
LLKALRRLPAALRARVEPDIIGTVARDMTDAVAELLARLAAGLSLRARFEPDIIGTIARDKRHLPAGWQMPGIEMHLAALRDNADAERQQWEKRVSRARSQRQHTRRRDILARELKGLAIAYSPDLANDERAAEAWVAGALHLLGVRYPDPTSRAQAFRRMFG